MPGLSGTNPVMSANIKTKKAYNRLVMKGRKNEKRLLKALQ